MRGIGKLVFLIAAALGLAAAQSPPPQKAASGEVPIFKTKAELVLVPVVVTDKKGEHIHGLTKDDFAIVEDDHSKEIKDFEAVHTAPRLMQQASSQELFTNTVKPAETQARVTIIVL